MGSVPYRTGGTRPHHAGPRSRSLLDCAAARRPPAVTAVRRAEGRGAPVAPGPRPGSRYRARARTRRRPPMRLTLRGRIVLTCGWTLLVLAGLWLAWFLTG